MSLTDTALRATLHDLFAEAVAAVSPMACMPEALPPPPPNGKRAIIAIGKAAAEMMRVAERRADTPVCGLVVTRHGHLPPGWPAPGSAMEVIEAGHPVPDAASARAASGRWRSRGRWGQATNCWCFCRAAVPRCSPPRSRG